MGRHLKNLTVGLLQKQSIFIGINASKDHIIHALLNCREDSSAAAGLSCAGSTPKHATPGV